MGPSKKRTYEVVDDPSLEQHVRRIGCLRIRLREIDCVEKKNDLIVRQVCLGQGRGARLDLPK